MKAIRSVTTDNGSEFADGKAIARATDWMNFLHCQKLNDISPKQAFFLAA